MEHYELLAILPDTFSEEEIKAIRSAMSGHITKHGGAITIENTLGLRKLAYPVKHRRQGFYVLIEFNAEPSALQPMNAALQLDTNILRHLIISKREKTEEDLAREQAMTERMKAKHAERLAKTEAAKEEKTKEAQPAEQKKKEEPTVSLEDLDKKLDEILDNPDMKL